MHSTPLLDQVQTPADLKRLSERDLPRLAAELREEMIDAVSQTGGHLGAGLGVVELTLALHYVFDAPKDKIIWDVGHQAYPHKILTARRDRIRTLRQPGGLSGFCARSESEYDPFGAGHSSTSISAALGMAVARDFKGEDNEIIAVIGDGAMSAGMAYEALNNAGAEKRRLIIVLNDNDMSIAPPVGAMSAYLSRLVSSRPYMTFRDIGKTVVSVLPEPLKQAAKRAEQYARSVGVGGGTWFEEMGMYYVGPVDGHNLEHLLPIFQNIKLQKHHGPILVHVVTRKGHGFAPAEAAADKLHGVNQFDKDTGIQKKGAGGPPTYTNVFAQALIDEASRDEKIIAITAAMPSGTGLDKFGAKYPARTFDVGIAEQHAVTFAAGLAAEGMKPFATIYSTFLQRAYDQVVHDVAVQNLPVRFAIDRAGLVGADGCTHAGMFDLAYLCTLPNFIVMAASDEAELVHMTATAAAMNDHPIAFRYPRGEGTGVALPERGQVLEIGKGRVLREGTQVAFFCLGTRMSACLKAAEQLEAEGISVTVADARFAKPLDMDLLGRLLREHALVVTVEEGSIGGFGSHVATHATNAGWLDGKAQLRALSLPDYFQAQGKPESQYEEAGMGAAQMVEFVRQHVTPASATTRKKA